MSWKASCVVDERMKFITEWLKKEESLSALARRFGISRPTGYKYVRRYELEGPAGLEDRSRAPLRSSRAIDSRTRETVLGARRAHMTWGPRKLLAWLERKHPGRRARWPSASTVSEWLVREGLVSKRRKRRRSDPCTVPFAGCDGPNAVWCVDFKGWFATRDGVRCNPLTITDAYSRFVIRCQALGRADEPSVRSVMEAAFREYGLPGAIRTDNGAPFASRAPCGFSRLSVWWRRLGIVHERIAPGCPEQNGRHERMHLTLKRDLQGRPARTLRGQQLEFVRWRREFNQERPHEALGNKTPGEVYEPSGRRYPEKLTELEYGETVARRKVDVAGVIGWRGRTLFVSEAFAGEYLGIEAAGPGRDRVEFAGVALGEIDVGRWRFERRPPWRGGRRRRAREALKESPARREASRGL